MVQSKRELETKDYSCNLSFEKEVIKVPHTPDFFFRCVTDTERKMAIALLRAITEELPVRKDKSGDIFIDVSCRIRIEDNYNTQGLPRFVVDIGTQDSDRTLSLKCDEGAYICEIPYLEIQIPAQTTPSTPKYHRSRFTVYVNGDCGGWRLECFARQVVARRFAGILSESLRDGSVFLFDKNDLK